MENEEQNFDNGQSNYNDSQNFDSGQSNYNDSQNFDNAQSNYNGSQNFDNAQSNYNNGQSDFNEDQQGWQTARNTGMVNGGYEHYVPEPEDGPGFSIAGMICGILSLLCCCVWYVGLVLGIVGLVLSIISLKQQKPGRGMAIAGVVCSAIGLGITLILGIFAILTMFNPEYQNFLNELRNSYPQYGNYMN